MFLMMDELAESPFIVALASPARLPFTVTPATIQRDVTHSSGASFLVPVAHEGCLELDRTRTSQDLTQVSAGSLDRFFLCSPRLAPRHRCAFPAEEREPHGQHLSDRGATELRTVLNALEQELAREHAVASVGE